jgi:hypothetical protein
MINDKKLPIAPIVAVIFLIAVCIIIGLLISKNTNKQEFMAVMDANQYSIGSSAKLKIVNNSSEEICFSSCYSYYVEKSIASGFKAYPYQHCDSADVPKDCIKGKDTKAFGLDIFSIEDGVHRLAIPYCISCSNADKFTADGWIYSNEFNSTN